MRRKRKRLEVLGLEDLALVSRELLGSVSEGLGLDLKEGLLAGIVGSGKSLALLLLLLNDGRVLPAEFSSERAEVGVLAVGAVT